MQLFIRKCLDLVIHVCYLCVIWTSRATTLLISNEEMNYIMKIVKSLEESGLLIKSVSEIIKNEAKEEKGGFLSMLLGKGTIAAGKRNN